MQGDVKIGVNLAWVDPAVVQVCQVALKCRRQRGIQRPHLRIGLHGPLLGHAQLRVQHGGLVVTWTQALIGSRQQDVNGLPGFGCRPPRVEPDLRLIGQCRARRTGDKQQERSKPL